MSTFQRYERSISRVQPSASWSYMGELDQVVGALCQDGLAAFDEREVEIHRCPSKWRQGLTEFLFCVFCACFFGMQQITIYIQMVDRRTESAVDESSTMPTTSNVRSGRSTPCIGDGHPTFNRESL